MTLTYEYGHQIEIDYTHSDYVNDGEYEYEVEPTDSDYIDFLMLYICPPSGCTKEQAQFFNQGAIDAFKSVLDDDFKKSIEEQSDFYDFMKEAYLEEAMQSIQDEYDDYD